MNRLAENVQLTISSPAFRGGGGSMHFLRVACAILALSACARQAPPKVATPEPARAESEPVDIGPVLGWSSLDSGREQTFGTANISASYFEDRRGLLHLGMADGAQADVYVLTAGQDFVGESETDVSERRYFAGRTPLVLPLHSHDGIYVVANGYDWTIEISRHESWRIGRARAAVFSQCLYGFTPAAAASFASFVETARAKVGRSEDVVALNLPPLEIAQQTARSVECAFPGMMALAAIHSELSISSSRFFDAGAVSADAAAAPAAPATESTAPAARTRAGPGREGPPPRTTGPQIPIYISMEPDVAADVLWRDRVIGQTSGDINVEPFFATEWVALRSGGYFQYTGVLAMPPFADGQYAPATLSARLTPVTRQ